MQTFNEKLEANGLTRRDVYIGKRHVSPQREEVLDRRLLGQGFAEIGRIMGVTGTRIMQLENKALRTLRQRRTETRAEIIDELLLDVRIRERSRNTIWLQSVRQYQQVTSEQ